MASKLQQRGTAVWFLTEQACCLMLAQSEVTDDFQACRQAVEFLAADDIEAVMEFNTRTGIVKGDPGALADYDIECYDSKERDLLGAIYEMLTLGNNPQVPDDARAALLKSAEIIASFYGADIASASTRNAS